jgi:hypothetical protein
MPSITRSVIVEMVCLDTLAPYTSARCAQISPWVNPLAGSAGRQIGGAKKPAAAGEARAVG